MPEAEQAPARETPRSTPRTDPRDDRILALLNKLGDQLIRSEKERVQLGQKLSALEAQQVIQNTKLEETQNLSQKVDSALNAQSRKLEQVSADKVRLIRKLERIEEAVVETREALQSKALVLLTDQATAARSGQPQLPADPALALPPPRHLRQTWQQWRPHITPRRIGMAAAAILVLLLGSWVIAHVPFSDSSATIAAMPPQPLPAVAETVPTPTLSPSPVAAVTTPTDALNETAQEAAPAPAVAAPPAISTADRVVQTPSPAPAKKIAAVSKASVPQTDAEIDAFMAQQREPGNLKERAQPDSTLPALARQIEKKAFDGVPEAQHDMAAIYTAGHAGVTPNYQKAAFWFREAALGGVANARYNLGVLYQQGMGVPKDLNRALGWYAAAAKLGHPEAEYNLGIAEVEGIGTPYDPQRAATLFEQAAKGGVVEAAYNLGLIEENGMLGAPNKPEALYWYKRAADHGSKDAEVALAQLSHSMQLTPVAVDQLTADLHHDAPAANDQPTALSPVTPAPSTHATVSPTHVSEDPDAHVSNEHVNAARTNDNAALLAQIQEQLMKHGLFPGPANGNDSAVTHDAIRAWQAANKLPIDGRASQALLANLLSTEQKSPAPQQTAATDATDDDGSLRPNDLQIPTTP